MSGQERRSRLIEKISQSDKPISASALAKEFGVSRQVIVQDVALLRQGGMDILATNRGYLLVTPNRCQRVFKVSHSDSDVEKELFLFVDNGAVVEDVFIYHKVYGTLRAELKLRSRRDVNLFLEDIASGKSTLLKNVTSNYHYHTVSAETSDQLDHIHDLLEAEGLLAPLQDYEPVDFNKS